MKMLEKLQKRLQEGKKDNKGFSLVELIIVIAIMAILVGIVGMAVIPQIENARIATDAQVLDAFVTEAMEAYTQVLHASGNPTITITNTNGTLSFTATAGNAFEEKFAELAEVSKHSLKSKSGKGATIKITCDPEKGVYIGDEGKVAGFEGYEFKSR